jgi:hypothetical protein
MSGADRPEKVLGHARVEPEAGEGNASIPAALGARGFARSRGGGSGNRIRPVKEAAATAPAAEFLA